MSTLGLAMRFRRCTLDHAKRCSTGSSLRRGLSTNSAHHSTNINSVRFFSYMCHPTRALHRERKGFKSRTEMVDTVSAETHYRSGGGALDLDLFEDPTGGLSSGPAEELTSTELEAQVRLLVSSYDANIYNILYTPFVDVIGVLVQRGVLPDQQTMHPAQLRPVEEAARWFADGASTMKNPTRLAEEMGPKRYAELCAGLHELYAPMKDVLPLVRVVKKFALREDLYTPLCRQLALNLVEPEMRRAAVGILPGLILALANGRAPASMGLPDDHTSRVTAVAELFLSAGQETGNSDLAYLAIQLIRANGMDVPFAYQKQLTNVFAASARIQTDWQTRATGQLIEIYPKWLEYYKLIRADNLKALQLLKEKDAEAASASPPSKDKKKSGKSKQQSLDKKSILTEHDGSDSDETQHHYFSSRRAEEVLRTVALEKNVEEAVRSREAMLTALASGRRGRRHVPPVDDQDREAANKDDDSAMSSSPDPADEVAVEEDSSKRASRATRKRRAKNDTEEEPEVIEFTL